MGVVTDRDIALHLGETDQAPSEIQVSEVMTTNIVACEPDADVHEVSRKMQEAQVRRVCRAVRSFRVGATRAA